MRKFTVNPSAASSRVRKSIGGFAAFSAPPADGREGIRPCPLLVKQARAQFKSFCLQLSPVPSRFKLAPKRAIDKVQHEAEWVSNDSYRFGLHERSERNTQVFTGPQYR